MAQATADESTARTGAIPPPQGEGRRSRGILRMLFALEFLSIGNYLKSYVLVGGINMAANMESVAKYLCNRLDWKVSNLKLQKLMYLSQLIYSGRTRRPLFDAKFQAWDFGPVLPDLYQKLKVFGATSVQDVFSKALDFSSDDPRRLVMDQVVDRFGKFSAGDLVEITHWDGGAWAKNYVPKARHIEISYSDILDEYKARNP